MFPRNEDEIIGPADSIRLSIYRYFRGYIYIVLGIGEN